MNGVMDWSKIEKIREVARGQGFKTGGRTAGTLNKRTETMLEEIASTGETPLQYMLRVMRDPAMSAARRDAMAIAAAPYIHSKLAQVDLTAQHNQNIIGVRLWTREEWLAYRDAQQGNCRLIANAGNDTVAINERDED
jgi:hypothetical protein